MIITILNNTSTLFICQFSVKKILLYIGFFNTGAYQDTISGYGGVHHCLVPQPKHILIDKTKDGNFEYKLFSEEQKPEDSITTIPASSTCIQ